MIRAQLDKPTKTIAEGIDQLHVVTSKPPLFLAALTTLAPYQIRVSIKATCVNYPDLLMLANQYQHQASFPFVPGLEWAGQITHTGASVQGYKVGDRIMGTGSGLCSHKTIDTTTTFPLLVPESLTYSQAAAFWVGFSTAYHCLVERGGLQPGQWILINGGTGGMGMAAVLLAKQLGAHVVVTGGTNEKLKQVCQCAHVPIHCCINYRQTPAFSQRVKACTPNNRGVDMVFDPVGGQVGVEGLKSTSWGGTILVVGFTGVSESMYQTYAANYILIKGLTVMGCRAGEYLKRKGRAGTAIAQARRQTLFEMASKGLVPYVCAEYVMTTTSVRKCFRDLYKRRIVGRAVVVLGGEEEKQAVVQKHQTEDKVGVSKL